MRMHNRPWRVAYIAVLVFLLSILLGAMAVRAEQSVDPATAERFDYLSTHGNSNCSTAFMNSIATMPAVARLQGSCCSPMSLGRYSRQIEGLKKFSAFAEIPADPYDVPAALAQQALASYDLALGTDEQRAYAYAMANSEEKGPCCCRCWRWHVYGGLAKLLIHKHGFSGEQVKEVWNLSDGCGGGEDPA
jgi:hypothetical protein